MSPLCWFPFPKPSNSCRWDWCWCEYHVCLTLVSSRYTVLIIPRFLLRCVSPLTATQARVCTLYRVAMTSLYIAMHWILLNQRAIIQCNKTIAHCTVLECTSLMCNNPLRSNIEHCCKQHSTGRHSICRVTITQIHKHKIELGGTLYSLHLQSDRLGREAAAWNNEPLPSQRTHCKHTLSHCCTGKSALWAAQWTLWGSCAHATCPSTFYVFSVCSNF